MGHKHDVTSSVFNFIWLTVSHFQWMFSRDCPKCRRFNFKKITKMCVCVLCIVKYISCQERFNVGRKNKWTRWAFCFWHCHDNFSKYRSRDLDQTERNKINKFIYLLMFCIAEKTDRKIHYTDKKSYVPHLRFKIRIYDRKSYAQ